MDFLEFLYRQFYPRAWLAWAEFHWNTDFEQAAGADGENPFRRIVLAFQECQIHELRTRAADLGRLKQILRLEKDRLFPRPVMDEFDKALLAYP